MESSRLASDEDDILVVSLARILRDAAELPPRRVQRHRRKLDSCASDLRGNAKRSSCSDPQNGSRETFDGIPHCPMPDNRTASIVGTAQSCLSGAADDTVREQIISIAFLVENARV